MSKDRADIQRPTRTQLRDKVNRLMPGLKC
ncbi:hypothetical protein GobsT_24580 [Gemmata obscuriglobus]|nr:hypothetical protein GobsT_24580 [Gemmata obscuriglobus]VTS04923.1 unnamed protein product [Gemmata obscuriglobus UQM 2246]